jgi:hypothetical protein
VAASTRSSAASIWESKALVAHAGGTLGLEPGACCLGAGKSDHADDCQASGPGCNRKKVIAPWLGDENMRSPFRPL